MNASVNENTICASKGKEVGVDEKNKLTMNDIHILFVVCFFWPKHGWTFFSVHSFE